MAEVTNPFETLDRERAKTERLAMYRNMAAEMMPAQDVLLRGALDALLYLERHGITEANCHQMLDDVTSALGMLHGTAIARGIELPDFLPQGERAN